MSDRRRTALALVLLMIIAPLTSAATTSWTGPSSVNPPDEGITLTGFRVPGNATVQDGWLHITNSEMATSMEPGIVWEGDDLNSGRFFGTNYISDLEQITLLDDGTRSNISTFDVGDIDVSMSDEYTYSPGWEHVYSVGSSTSETECNNQSASWVDHGYDNNFDGSLSSDEITGTLMYCSGNALEDSVTTLNVTNGGSGYTAGTLSATGGSGSGFAGTYTISSAISSISISNGGTGYVVGDYLAFVCPGGCTGTGANATVASVASNGSITSVTVNNGGSGYTSQQTMYVLVSSANGGGAQLSSVLESTGSIYEAFVTDGGSGYTSAPTIVPSSSGTSAVITAGLGGFFDYEITVTSVSSGLTSQCMLGGYMVNAGMDTDEDSMLDPTEITDTTYLCNIQEMWGATTFNHNGTNLGSEQTMPYGTIPSSATEGIVAVGTMPGSAVPRGTSSSFLLPPVNLPDSETFNGLYMTFDHWYHLDSTTSGGGDGAWVEYRINTGSWGDWTYIAPDGGYTSTMSTDAPSPNGAPSGAVPVFASATHSGWLSENISISSITDIDDASKIQFRFHIWTSPNATYERPGWFLDNIDFNNDGVDFGVWHHGCMSLTSSSCNYVANSYGALQRTIDLSGTNSTSSIEIDMEWDLQGSTYDNACIELSLNNVTWYDLSSTGTTSTASACEDRSGAIPGYPSYDGIFGDQSNAIRTVEYSIPTAYQNQANVHIRFVVDTDSWTNYGGNYPGDTQEGFTLEDIRVVDDSGTVLFRDDLENQNTMTHYGTGIGTSIGYDDWNYYILTGGVLEEIFGFEDSTASNPTSSNAPGWSKQSAWNYGQLGTNAGPDDEPSFPYVYGTNLNGNYGNGQNSFLTSPTYSIPTDGLAYVTFDKWICTENNWDAIALQFKVNGGSWNYFDPQIPGWYDGNPSYISSISDAWMNGDCNQDYFENRKAPLSNYAGDDLRFRFQLYSDSSVTYQGGYIDNFGILIANYGSGGYWLSNAIDMSSIDIFNYGWVDIEATVPENTSIRGSLIDLDDNVIPGYNNITFPFSLAGVDSEEYESLRIKVIMDTNDEEVSPKLTKISIGGKRYLAASSADYNGWDFSPSIEVVDELLNATSIAGTITSDYIHSSRPIKSVTLSGNFSSGLMITAFSSTGATLGQTSQGSIPFTIPQTGFSLSVSLPTNGWIDRMVISSNFAEPAENPAIDVLNDGSVDWSFPMGYDYGYYGWQSLISDGVNSYTTGSTINLESGTPSSIMVRLPSLAAVNNGIISVAPDSDGQFDSPITLTVGSSSQTSSSNSEIFHCILDYSQIAGINSLSTSHVDSDTSRQWRDVTITLESNYAQTVSISTVGIGYLIFENVSGLGPSISDYHNSMTQDDPPPTQVSIPVNITADKGSVAIDGDLKFDYIVTNRDFNVPNTLYPNGETVEIITKHHHLNDNSNLETISLRGIASDGEILLFEVTNSADGLWGQGSDAVTFTQVSGSSVAPMSPSTFLEITTHNDGYDDVTVHWMFDVSWMWDDVNSIRWVAQAFDQSGETVWPSVSHSGESGKNAVENDLMIDSFEVRDQFGRLLSNQYSTFYPFTMTDGSELNITGTVKFQDSIAVRPQASDYTVGLNISGLSYLLTSEEGGVYNGLISSPTGLSNVYLSPMMNTVGPTGYSLGAEDVTGTPPSVNVRIDHEPPVAGPLEVNTPSGLKAAHGKVWDPTVPLSLFVTVDESEARGEILTLKYWRGSVDDTNGDGIADEDEYLSMVQPLTPGMTGQQQVNFVGIDVSQQSFNSPVHLYIEGTDWAGLTYQDGGTGGSYGASNSWATVVVATDEPTSIKSAGYSLDRDLGYLLPGKQHTFTMQIEEANGLNTLDNVSIMLCGDGISELGKMSYDPSRGTIWSDVSSHVTPISVQTMQVSSDIVQLSMQFEVSWDFPWEEGQNSCKPSVSIVDDFTTVAYQNNIGELSWYLDNKYVAIPDYIEDLTPPQAEAEGVSVYLGQGDEFRMSGFVYHSGSGSLAADIPEDLEVEFTVIYGTQEISIITPVNEDASFDSSMILPSRVPLNPTMPVSTEVLNVPGLGSSDINEDASVTVDSKAPTVLFDQSAYPDSSLVLLESDLISDVLVTVTMVEEIGMIEGPLDVAWVVLRSGTAVAGSENTGQLTMIDDGEDRDIYQGYIDFTPLNGMSIEQGDQIAFWVTSTDRAGNKVTGLGSENAPRMPTLRIMKFNPEYSRVVINPTSTPMVGEMVTMQTFWENDGKREGTITVGLYELNPETGQWSPALTTLSDGPTEISLGAQSSSVIATFQWESWREGQPLLVLILEDPESGEMDWNNDNGNNIDLSGINVQPLPVETESNSGLYMVIAVAVIAVAVVAILVMRNRGDQEYYYDDDEEEYENDWEYEEEEYED
ncbi:MAG: DUF7151 family protein [Candidatus Thalassarchaeaceae archaeon]